MRFDPLWWLDADTRAVEALAALIALTFAIVLMLSGELFVDLPGYRVMAALLPQKIWSFIFLGQWALQSLAMCGNVWILRYPSALMGFLLWTLVGVCLWMVSPQALAPYLFWWLATFMAWVIWKGPTDGCT